jgi:TolB-like protein/Tfp pilus assembly protein PilF
MKPLKSVILEAHRRSLWQVLLVYVGGALVAYQAVQALTEGLELPQWFPWLAVVLFIIGLPFVVATALVRETPALSTPRSQTEAPEVQAEATAERHEARRRHRFLTWRNAVASFVVALAVWGIVAAGWLVLGTGADDATQGPTYRSVAVLPLDNFTGDPEQEYFVDGMTEQLTTELANISELLVISRTSVMQYKDTEKPLREIGRELGVQVVVEGSVTRGAGKVRINAQLVETMSDRHLWADSYERDLEDVLALQGEVARAIAREIQVRLTPEEEERLTSRRPIDPDAYDTYLRGRHHWSRFTEGDLRKAIGHFENAIAIDSTYAPAYAGLADALAILAFFGLMEPDDAFRRARRAAQRALELDESLAEAHTTLGRILYVYDWNWEGAEQAFRRAIELNQSFAGGHHSYAVFLVRLARFEEAERMLDRALQLDPLSPRMNNNSAWIPFLARDYRTAIQAYQNALALNPEFAMSHRELAWAYVEVGEYGKAIQEAERAVELSADDFNLASLGYVLGLSGETQRALQVLGDLEARTRDRYVSPTNLALIHIGLGNTAAALDWLELAVEDRSAFLANLAVHPFFDALRPEERFRRILRQVGLDEAVGD